MSNTITEAPTFAKNITREKMEKLREMANLRRYTMEKGPSWVDGTNGEARSIGEVFREYMSKTTFLKVGETQNSSYIGMVNPEVKSRNSSKRRPEGQYVPIGGLFKDTALLTANIQALDKGTISESALLRQYPEANSIGELRRMLGGLLGRIYYGEPKKVEPKNHRVQKYQTMIEVRSPQTNEDQDHVFLMPLADYLKRVEKYESKKRTAKIAITSAFSLVTLVACDAATIVQVPTPTATEAVKPSPVVKITEPPKDEKPTAKPEATQNVLKPGKGGLESESVYQSEQSKKDMAGLDSCVAYWGGTLPAVALPDKPGSDTSSLHYKFMPDLGKNDGSGVVVLESGIDDVNWNGKVGMQPFKLWKNDRQGCNLDEKGKPVQTGMDPFKLSTTSGPELVQYGIPEGSSLGFYNGGWVMVNSNGEIVGKVNENGDWEGNKFTAENLKKIPRSEAEIVNCVEIASPIDNWDQYNKDMDKVLALFPKVMENYNGPFIVAKAQDFGIDTESMMFLKGAVLSPVMCVKFKYKDTWVVQMTMAAKDKNGFVPLNIVLDPEATDESDFMIKSVDKVLKILPHTVGKNMSAVTTLFSPWSGSSESLNTKFVYDYYSNKNNLGFAEIIWNSWLSKNEFDPQGAKRAVVLSDIQLPHDENGLIKP